MDPALKHRQGQALVETALTLPLFVIVLWGLQQWHRVVLADFEATRQLRKIITDKRVNERHSYQAKDKKNQTLQVAIKKTWPAKKPVSSPQKLGIKIPTFPTPPSHPGQVIDLLFAPHTVSITYDREGLWPDQTLESFILTPGILRDNGHLWATGLSGLGSIK